VALLGVGVACVNLDPPWANHPPSSGGVVSGAVDSSTAGSVAAGSGDALGGHSGSGGVLNDYGDVAGSVSGIDAAGGNVGSGGIPARDAYLAGYDVPESGGAGAVDLPRDLPNLAEDTGNEVADGSAKGGSTADAPAAGGITGNGGAADVRLDGTGGTKKDAATDASGRNSGGRIGSGGAATGGALRLGGTHGSGGVPGSGGATGSGGASALGGTTASGGATASGGVDGSAAIDSGAPCPSAFPGTGGTTVGGTTASGVVVITVPLATADQGQRFNYQNYDGKTPNSYSLAGATLDITAYAPNATGGDLRIFFTTPARVDSPATYVPLSTFKSGFTTVSIPVPDADVSGFDPATIMLVRIEVEAGGGCFGTAWQTPATTIYIDSISTPNGPFNDSLADPNFAPTIQSSGARSVSNSTIVWAQAN